MKLTIEQIDAAESFITQLSDHRKKLFAGYGIKKRLPPEETILFALHAMRDKAIREVEDDLL